MRPQHRLRAAQCACSRGSRRPDSASAQVEQRVHHAGQQRRARGRISSRSHRRVSSETCSLRLRPVWILSATRAGLLLQLADDAACGRLRRRRLRRRPARRLRRESRRRRRRSRARSSAVRMPTRSSARAKACEPRISASISRRSKSSEPEKRSKTSEGPSSKRPPQSFISALSRPSAQRPHLDRQPDQVDEAQRVLLVVAGAHGEAGDIERVERIRRLAADRLDVAFVQPQRDLAGGRLADLLEERVQRFAQRREPQAVVDQSRRNRAPASACSAAWSGRA